MDVNSFFASCEQLFRPDLRGKPVVILSNNDGCIVARSKEAKALGIPDLEPYFKLKGLLKHHRVHVFSSNYELYGDLSSRVMSILEGFSPDSEIYSIDEAFLSLDGMNVNLPEYGQKIRHAVQQHVGLPVGVGIAETKTLAKLASFIAKRSPRCQYVCVIKDVSDWKAVFKKIRVGDVWGIGKRLSRRLGDQAVFSVWDLITQDERTIHKHYNINVARTLDELKGNPRYGLDQNPEPKKQIFSTRSFGNKIFDCASLEQSVSQYATRACAKLRSQNSLVKTISVFASAGHFIDNHYSRSVTIRLDTPTNDTRLIISKAREAVRESIFRSGVPFARAGIGLIEIHPERPEQLDAFSESQTQRSKDLMRVFDRINTIHSPLFFASQGIDPSWKMQRNMKSPNYTTSLKDIPRVKV